MTRDPVVIDPDVLDRGGKAHKQLQTTVSEALSRVGIEPLSPRADDPDFDIGWQIRDAWFIGEVKSTTTGNEATQIRLGIAQLLEYRFALASRHPTVVAVLIVEKEPNVTRWSDLLESLGITLVWPETLDAFVAGLGQPEETSADPAG